MLLAIDIGNTNIKDIILDTPGYFGGTVDLLYLE